MLLVFCVAAVYAQQNYKVSTEKEKKGILIEEFTGMRCQYCYEGHQISGSIVNGYKGQVQLVCIHTGRLSPSSGKYVYKTEDGDAIATEFGARSFPSAMICRKPLSGSYMLSRDGWRSMTDRNKDDIAIANLYAEASYDNSTRDMNIRIEGYNTSDNSSKDMRLNVLITQDNLEGTQATPNGTIGYTHMHVLRDYITPTSGDAISNKAEGEYFTAEYKYSLPEEITGQVVKPENINIIVFITEDGMKRVANVKGIKPEYKNMNIKAQVEMTAPDINVGKYYGYQYFEANVFNNSAETMKKATFDVNIDDNVNEVVADCNIAPFSKGTVKVPCSYEIKEGKNVKYAFTIKRINDTDIDAKTLKGSFECPSVVNNNINVKFVSDRHAAENELTIKDMNGNIVKSFGPFKNGRSVTVDQAVKIEKAGTYCVELTDNFGDGVEFSKQGSLNVSCDNGPIENFSNIPSYGARVFFTIEDNLGINDVTIEENGNGKTYSINGMVIDGSSNNERIVIKNGKKYIK